MFVVIKEVIAALAVGAMVYTAVFARFGGVELAEGAGDGLKCEFFV